MAGRKGQKKRTAKGFGALRDFTRTFNIQVTVGRIPKEGESGRRLPNYAARACIRSPQGTAFASKCYEGDRSSDLRRAVRNSVTGLVKDLALPRPE